MKVLLSAILALTGISAGAVVFDLGYRQPDFSITENGTTLYYFYTYNTTDQVGLTYSKDDPYTATKIVVPPTVKYQNKTYTVTSICEGTFRNNKTLEDITLPPTLIKVNNYVFLNCSNLKYTRCSGSLAEWCQIGFASNPISASHNLFINNDEPVEGELVIPTGIRNFINVFTGLHTITSVTFPELYSSIYMSSSFTDCVNVKNVTVPSLDDWFRISFMDYSPTYFSHTLTVGGEELTDLVVPENITAINDCQFQGLSSLKSITFHENFTRLCHQCFQECTGLTKLSFPPSLTTIDQRVFEGCTGLTGEIVIPENVTYLSWGCFTNCTGIESFVIKGLIDYSSPDVFRNCSGLKKFDVADLKNYFEKIAIFYEKEDAPTCFTGVLSVNGREVIDMTIPEGVTNIGAYALYGAKKMKKLTFPSTVKSVGKEAFGECEGLELVEAPSLEAWLKIRSEDYNTNLHISPVTYSHKLLLGGEILTDVTIPESITSISSFSFQGWDWLKALTIPNHVTNISGERALYDCTSLESLYIGTGLTNLAGTTTERFPKLRSVFCASPTPPRCYGWAQSVTANATLFVPNGCSEVYKANSLWKDFYRIIELDFDGVESVEATDSHLSVSAVNGTLTINGANPGAHVAVYTPDGRTIHTSTADGTGSLTTHIPFRGIAIVTVNASTTKLTF